MISGHTQVDRSSGGEQKSSPFNPAAGGVLKSRFPRKNDAFYLFFDLDIFALLPPPLDGCRGRLSGNVINCLPGIGSELIAIKKGALAEVAKREFRGAACTSTGPVLAKEIELAVRRTIPRPGRCDRSGMRAQPTRSRTAEIHKMYQNAAKWDICAG